MITFAAFSGMYFTCGFIVSLFLLRIIGLVPGDTPIDGQFGAVPLVSGFFGAVTGALLHLVRAKGGTFVGWMAIHLLLSCLLFSMVYHSGAIGYVYVWLPFVIVWSIFVCRGYTLFKEK